MCIPMTPVLYYIITVINEVHLQCFTESVSLKELGKPISRAEIGSPNSLYLKVVKEAHIRCALIVPPPPQVFLTPRVESYMLLYRTL